MPKESFILYKSFYEPVKSLSDKQLGRLFRALFSYQLEGSTQVDADLQMAFAFFKNQMDLDEVKYQKVVQRNKQNGSNGGRPTKEENPKNPVGLKKPKKPDTDTDTDTEKDNDIKKESKKKTASPFSRPSLDEVCNYFSENGYSESSAKKAWKYYEEGNWHDSKGNQVKRWKQKMQGVWFKPENEIKKNDAPSVLENGEFKGTFIPRSENTW